MCKCMKASQACVEHNTMLLLMYEDALDYHVRIKIFETYLCYCCFCISDTLYLSYILRGSGRHIAPDYYCQTIFEYKYSISYISCNSSILM